MNGRPGKPEEHHRYGSIGGSTRKAFSIPEGWVESLPDAMPTDSHIAEMTCFVDANGGTRKQFRIVLKPSVVRVLADKAKQVILEIHAERVRHIDRELLKRKQSLLGLR